jgi:hypothetical protein
MARDPDHKLVARASNPKALFKGECGARPKTYAPIPRLAIAVATSRIQLMGAPFIDLTKAS